TPMASAMAAKFGFSRSVPVVRKPVDICSSSTKPSLPLLKTTIFTGSRSCVRLKKSPISMLKPPSPESEMTCLPGNAACAPDIAPPKQRQQGDNRRLHIADDAKIDRGSFADILGPDIDVGDANTAAAGIELPVG